MIPGISETILDLHLVSNRQWNIASSDALLPLRLAIFVAVVVAVPVDE